MNWIKFDESDRYYWYAREDGLIKKVGKNTGREHSVYGCGNGHGYLTVRINKKLNKIHRIIGKVFIPNPENKPCINHKNGIKDDNRVENLEWVTHSENNKHAYDTLGKKGYYSNHEFSKETKLKISMKGRRGNNPFAKKCIVNGVEYKCIADAAEELDIKYGCIIRRLNSPNFKEYKYANE